MKITENFTYIGTQQNFERDSYATLAEMKAVVDKRMPDIFTATCKETGKFYIYNKNNEVDETLGKWREIGINGDDYVTKTYVDTEIAKKADITSIPSKVSELTNDSDYQTAEQISSTVTAEIAKVVADAPENFDTLKEMSDWIAGHENDASTMNSAILDNKTAITALQTDKADKSEIPTTVAQLTDSADYAKTSDVNASIKTLQTDKANTSDLTAHTGDSVIHVTAENKTLWNTVSNKVNKEDGKALLADTDKTNYDDAVTKAHTHENKEVLDGITSDKVTYWDNKSEFSGSYNDLNDKPTIDAELSNTSENAIQNKVLTKEINKLYSDISFNDFDTATDGISFTDAEDGNMLVANATRNLLNPTLETTTENGVTCTRNVDVNGNPDGTYTLNGTATENAFFYLIPWSKIAAGNYRVVGCPVGGSNDGYYIDINAPKADEVNTYYHDIGNGVTFEVYDKTEGDNIVIQITVIGGTTVSNIVFKPMITTDLNATYDDFVPYSGYDIKTCGKNLFKNYDYYGSYKVVSETYNGNSVIYSSDDWQGAYQRDLILKKGKTYAISAYIKGSGICLAYCNRTDNVGEAIAIMNSGNTLSSEWTKITIVYTPSIDVYRVRLEVIGGSLYISCFQIEEGAQVTAYEPYTG